MPAACLLLHRVIVLARPQPTSPPSRLTFDDVHPPLNQQVLTASAYTGLPPAPSQQQEQQQKEPGVCPLGPNTSSGSGTSFLPLEPTTYSNMSSRARCVRDLGRVYVYVWTLERETIWKLDLTPMASTHPHMCIHPGCMRT